jgi:hypothetical protein
MDGGAQLEPDAPSPLTRARLRATLTVDEAAMAAGITADEARWLEEGRLYRFADTDAAIAATIAYAGAVGALEAGARRGEEHARRSGRRAGRRALAVAAALAVAGGIAAAVLAATHEGGPHAGPASAQQTGTVSAAGAPAPGATAAGAATAAAPAPLPVIVDAVDAAGRPTATRTLVRRLRTLGYRVGRVATAGRTDEPDTAVYFEQGGAAAGARLGRVLGVPARPLPAGDDPRRLVVVVGRSGLGR